MSKSILIPVSQGTEEMEAVIVADILRRASLDVQIVGEFDIIKCSNNVRLLPDILVEELDINGEFEAIIIPGGSTGVKNLSENETIVKVVKKHFASGRLLGAICAAPLLLAEHKIIPFTTAITSHPSVKTQLMDYNYMDNPVVVDKNLITSRGAGTAIQFALTIVEILKGQEKANKVAEAIVF